MWFYKILQLQKMFLQKNLKHFGCVWDLKPKKKKKLLQKEKKTHKEMFVGWKRKKNHKEMFVGCQKEECFWGSIV